MKTTSVQLDPETHARLKLAAKRTGVSASKMIRHYVAQGLRGDSPEATALDVFGGLVGHFKGPRDLSTRKAFEAYPDDRRHAQDAS